MQASRGYRFRSCPEKATGQAFPGGTGKNGPEAPASAPRKAPQAWTYLPLRLHQLLKMTGTSPASCVRVTSS